MKVVESASWDAAQPLGPYTWAEHAHEVECAAGRWQEDRLPPGPAPCPSHTLDGIC